MTTRKGKSEGRSTASTSLDVEALRQVVEIVEASEITNLVWTNGRERLSIRRGSPLGAAPGPTYAASPVHSSGVVPHGSSSSATSDHKARPSSPARAGAAETAAGDKKGHLITSPFVGTFYRTPAPDQPPYVEVGAVVKKGQVLCIIEAMKLMNEIESEVAGRVTEVLAQNAQPVEFGQPLFRLEPV